MNFLRILGGLGLALLALPASAAPIAVVAAENFYGDLARQIGGDGVTVTSILSNPDEDPHLFETSASTARLLADAGIVIYNGAGYDPFMDKLLASGATGERTVIVAASLTGHRDGDNPHIWYDPKTFPAVARALAAALEARDPAHAADYAANLRTFLASFAETMTSVDAVRAAHAGTAVTATEPVFGYMAEAMGLRMLNLGFQTATMNDTEPAPSDVAAFETSLQDGSVKILFYNSQVTDDTTVRLRDLATASGVPVVGVTETEPAGQTIQSWFGGQIAAVQQALETQR